MAEQRLPERADVVVIGGGVVGCSTALFLARRGVSVVLVEKGEIGEEQSGRNWGWVCQAGVNPREVPLMVLSVRTWQRLAGELSADLEFIQQGSLGLAYTEGELARQREWAREAKEAGLEAGVLDREGVRRLIPQMEGAWVGGIFTPTDGQAEPRKATLAIAREAQEYGARIFTGCTALGLDLANRRVAAVATTRGEVKAPVVVCAGGAWSARLLRRVGLDLPVRLVRSTVAETAPLPHITHTTVWGEEVAFRQKRDGAFYIAAGMRGDYDVTLDSLRHLGLFLRGYWRRRRYLSINIGRPLVEDLVGLLPWVRRDPFPTGVEPRPNLKNVETSRRGLQALLPSLGEVTLRRAWAGIIDTTPDACPVVGEAPGVEGLLVATGFSGHGFAMGPGAGLALADLVVEGKPPVDLHPLRFSRFREGDMADWRKTI